jgi:hypothetical protein
MPPVGFEPMIPVFERPKTVHALDRTAIVIGIPNCHRSHPTCGWKTHTGKDHFWKEAYRKGKEKWIAAVEIDCREILKLRNWKRKSRDRKFLRCHLKEAKARLRAVAPHERKKKKKKKKNLV